jgi:probable phosphoglycerate mutase
MGPTNRVVLVRHGETEWSKSGQHTGREDIPLTEVGRRQAALLRAPLGQWSFARVLVSPLSRARDTCTLVGLGERAEPDPDLMEWDYGTYEGRKRAEILRENPDWSLWHDGCPGGEKPAQVGARADRVLERVRAVDGDVVLFGHGHTLRVLAARWLGRPVPFGAHLALSTTSLSALGQEHGTDVLWLWNDTAHLRKG